MKEFVFKLKSLGFTEYESKVFIAVLKGRLMSASEIADNAGIRRTDVYNILKTFVDRGYCNEIETNSVLKYEMIDPDIIFDKIEREIINEKEKELVTLKETITNLKPLYRSEETEKSKIVNIEVIRGYNQHREGKFVDLLKSSQREIHFMIRPEIFLSEEIDNIASDFYKKGGVIKSIYQAGENYKIKKENKWVKAPKKDFVRILELFQKAGEKIKVCLEEVPTIVIFDRETVYININDKTLPRHNEADLIIRNKNFAESMVKVFDTFWKDSLTIEEYKIIN